MAVIAEKTVNGIKIRIRDDCMMPKGTPEWEQTAENQRRVAYDILRKWGETHGNEEDCYGYDERG